MATFEDVLVSTLQSGSTVQCYPIEKPQSVTTPVCVYKRISTVRERILNSKSTFNRVRMGLTVYGTSFKTVKTAVNSINAKLDENTTDFTLSQLIDHKDFKDPANGLFYTYLEYVIFSHLN